jgi:hypothetical protein
MITEENISMVIQIATLVGIVFGVYLYFRKPQERGEITDAVMEEKFTQLDRELANLRDNHIHTVTTDLRNHIIESQGAALASAEKLGRIEGKLDMLINK